MQEYIDGGGECDCRETHELFNARDEGGKRGSYMHVVIDIVESEFSIAYVFSHSINESIVIVVAVAVVHVYDEVDQCVNRASILPQLCTTAFCQIPF
jgi:hypothetical protein